MVAAAATCSVVEVEVRDVVIVVVVPVVEGRVVFYFGEYFDNRGRRQR